MRVHKWALAVAVVVFAGFYASGHPHLRAETEDPTASSTDAPSVIMDAAHDPEAAQIPEQELVFFEKERNLVLLPLENATDDADLDYLRTGLMRILADRLQSTRYLRLDRPERRLVVAPRGADWEDVNAYRYSRAIVADSDPTAIERIILRVYARELDEQTFNILPLADPARQAFALKADYLITGSIESISSTANRVAEQGTLEGEGLAGDSDKSLEERIREQQQQNIDRPRRREADPVRVRLRLYDAVTAETREFHFEDRPANLYRAITTIADEMQAALIGGELVPVSFETPEPGAMVFLDDLYLGRTPLNTTVLAGQYALRVAQPDHHTVRRMVAISAQTNQNYLVRNRKIERRAGLKVSSDPPGAKVYLNMDYLGETPLERTDLPPGSHRL
ncbi:MAG: PEGA domain-containing protein, partial [Leptospiraceae bacterium]|nr:PEGA domain-containing protein [Leptospiraceae bacterium]